MKASSLLVHVDECHRVDCVLQVNNKEDFIGQLKADLASIQRQQKETTEKV